MYIQYKQLKNELEETIDRVYPDVDAEELTSIFIELLRDKLKFKHFDKVIQHIKESTKETK